MLTLVRVTLLLVFAASGLGLVLMSLMWWRMRLEGLVRPAGFEFYWVMSAVFLLASWFGRRWLIHKYAQRDRRDFARVQAEGCFEASGSSFPAFALLLLALICGVGGWTLFVEGRPVLGITAIGIVGLLAWAGLDVARIRLRAGPTLRMDGQVVDYAAYGSIAWTNVIAIHLESVQVQYHTRNTLSLCVREPRRYLRNTPALMRWIQARRLRGFDEFGPLTIPLDGLNRDPELIQRAALELRSRHDPPLLVNWHPRVSARETVLWSRLEKSAQEAERIVAAIKAAEGDPELMASLELELSKHLENHEALFPEVRSTVAASAKRARQQRLVGWLLAALAFAWMVLGIVRSS